MKTKALIATLLVGVGTAEQVQIFSLDRKLESIPVSQIIGCKTGDRKSVSMVLYISKKKAIREVDIDLLKLEAAMKPLPSDGENPLFGEADAFRLVSEDGRVLALALREKETGIIALSPAKDIGGGNLVKTGESRVVDLPELQAAIVGK